VLSGCGLNVYKVVLWMADCVTWSPLCAVARGELPYGTSTLLGVCFFNG
jgi:hypothetical protein